MGLKIKETSQFSWLVSFIFSQKELKRDGHSFID